MSDIEVVKMSHDIYYWACDICGELGSAVWTSYIDAEDYGRIHVRDNHATKPTTVLMTNEQINDFVRRLRVANEKVHTAPFFAQVETEKICQEMQLLTLDPKYR